MTTGGLVNAAAAVAAILPATPVDPGTPPVTEPPVTEPPAPEPPPSPAPVIPDVGQLISNALPIVANVGEVRLSGIIGDSRFGSRDVDMYQVRVEAGQTLVIDIDAQTLPGGSKLDSFLRVFDARGVQRKFNDDFGGSLDSRLFIRPQKAGIFYVGVSGYRNFRYDARSGWGARDGSTGDYQLALTFGEMPARRRTTEVIRMLGFADVAPQPQPQSHPGLFAALGVKRTRR